MILSIAGKNHILNTNFITALNYRSVYGRSVIDCVEEHELILLLWCGEGRPDTFESYVKKVVQDPEIISKCLLFKTALIDPGKQENARKTKETKDEDFNFENGILRIMALCNIPAEYIHHCTVKDIFDIIPKPGKEEKQHLMTEDELTAEYFGKGRSD